MEKLTEKDTKAIADYAKIALDEAQVIEFTDYLNETIKMINPILDIDIENVDPTFHPIGNLRNVMREDEPNPSFTQDEALANAPLQEDGAFKIPSPLAEGGDQ
ncbi:MAG: Asp-tRNA(Asn)/Glu-tRNA(Gln) amidotransferase subunit GatC [Coriobacteriales bacterium]|nr:Asp-tRNA(Asn)/Glu-tRNA(Gln) amidotransferase subunit GatC [Coriobacteriales bacterium]